MIPSSGGNTESHWKFSSPKGKKTKPKNTTTTKMFMIHTQTRFGRTLMSSRWTPNLVKRPEPCAQSQTQLQISNPDLDTASSLKHSWFLQHTLTDVLLLLHIRSAESPKMYWKQSQLFKLASQLITLFYIYLIPPPKLYDQDYRYACKYFSLTCP